MKEWADGQVGRWAEETKGRSQRERPRLVWRASNADFDACKDFGGDFGSPLARQQHRSESRTHSGQAVGFGDGHARDNQAGEDFARVFHDGIFAAFHPHRTHAGHFEQPALSPAP
jgi:hypothetical protein